jgi:hypothetical protein
MEGGIGPAAVSQPEHLVAHRLPAPRLLPEIGGMQRRKPELLCADAIHLGAHDRGDLLAHAKPEGQQRVDARHELANEAGPHQQLVAHRFGVGRIVAQGGNESLSPTHGTPDWREISGLSPPS